jgi:enediyne biosynthesis protein E4
MRIVFFWIILVIISCSPDKAVEEPRPHFTRHQGSATGIDFQNILTEDEQFNIIEYLYFYNGAGVSVGDVNNDSLPDIYLVSNQKSNKLYLNKGNWRFEDITEQAGVSGKGNWKTGTVMADVNGDGFLDIYTCGVGNYKGFNSTNQLYINNGDLTFTEQSVNYGLDFTGFSTHAVFFDYDRDGDLDMYLLNHSVHSVDSYGRASLRIQPDSLSGDRLYENQLIPSGKNYFLDVTRNAGIYSSKIGYGLGVGVSDLNNDGWPDIYVSNDFHENDYLYLNNGDKTFKEVVTSSMPHTSRFSMGNDLADINNDGWIDVFSTDMFPRQEGIIKTTSGEDSYEIYNFKLGFGYHSQVSRNALQINQGIGTDNLAYFSDIAPLVNVSSTDWSWSPMLVDFDGDGWKDIYITNGILRRPNDLDYANFISSDSIRKQLSSNQKKVWPWLSRMPSGRISNFRFRNCSNGDFEQDSLVGGIDSPGFSHGIAVGDFDGDGDSDYVINNLNSAVSLWENQASDRNTVLKIRLIDSLSANLWGIGAKISIYANNVTQHYEISTARGWCSSSSPELSVGIGKALFVDSIIVRWPDGTFQQVKNREHHVVVRKNSNPKPSAYVNSVLLRSVSVPFKHQEDNFNSISREGLIPRMLTEEGPALAVGDVNQDALEDFFIGGAKGQPGKLFVQQIDHTFKTTFLFEEDSNAEDTDASFFDADNDNDLDLIVVSGGQEEMKVLANLQPRLYINDGQGVFTKSKEMPQLYLHASCVRPCDFDKDGDNDLFIGASVIPMLYGMAPTSYLLLNDGTGKFSVINNWLGNSRFDNPSVNRPGIIRDATWADLNGDDLMDLVLVGDWMPITILQQSKNHEFANVTSKNKVDSTLGWWNSVYVNDFDDDGDLDIVAGNFGLNSRLRASKNEPLTMYLGDFDSNGNSDHILVYYNEGRAYPFTSRDQLVKQLPSLKRKFLRYADYRDVLLEDIVTPQQKGNSAVLKAYTLKSSYFENSQSGFIERPLPLGAQSFPIHAILSDDFNSDGILDLLVAGNETALQPEIGPMDAGLGLILLGNGRGGFDYLPPQKSGLYLRGNVRSGAILDNVKGTNKRFIFGVNNDSVRLYQFSNPN